MSLIVGKKTEDVKNFIKTNRQQQKHKKTQLLTVDSFFTELNFTRRLFMVNTVVNGQVQDPISLLASKTTCFNN